MTAKNAFIMATLSGGIAWLVGSTAVLRYNVEPILIGPPLVLLVLTMTIAAYYGEARETEDWVNE